MNLPKLPSWLHNFVDHNRYTAGAFALIFLVNGCALVDMLQPKVASPITGEKATRAQLEQERNIDNINIESEKVALEAQIKSMIDGFNTRVSIANEKWGGTFKELDKKDAFVTNALMVATKAPGSSLPEIIFGLLGATGLIYGTGKQLDNSRKDAVIEDKKGKIRTLETITNLPPTV